MTALREALSDWPKKEIDDFIARNYPNYWLRTDTATQVMHANVVRKAMRSRTKLATSVTTDEFTAVTELTIFAPNHARLLSLFAGACAAAGANIAGAHITTTRDGYALDTFLLNREFKEDADELRRAQRVSKTIEQVLSGKERLRLCWRVEGRRLAGSKLLPSNPRSSSTTQFSDRLTVIEVSCRDRPGLLYELTSALSDLSLDIASAHVTTFGEKAVDVFYVTDLVGKQVINTVRQAAIRDRLKAVMAGDGSGVPKKSARG